MRPKGDSNRNEQKNYIVPELFPIKKTTKTGQDNRYIAKIQLHIIILVRGKDKGIDLGNLGIIAFGGEMARFYILEGIGPE